MLQPMKEPTVEQEAWQELLPMLEQSIPERLPLVERRTLAGAVHEGL